MQRAKCRDKGKEDAARRAKRGPAMMCAGTGEEKGWDE